MRIAHLLLIHEYNAQLERLIQKLSHPEADIYIHVDLKKNIEDFAALKKHSRVYLVLKRVKVYWGSFTIVQATINGFAAILSSGKEYGYINLLSGQDYPVQSINNIHKFLGDNPGKAFMEYYLVNEVWTEAITRITRYHLANYTFAGRYTVEKWLNKIMPERKLPYGLTAVGRSQWFTIASEFARYILDYIKSHPRIVKFFKLSWAPDELFFQTILHNSEYRDRMVNDNLRYIDWSEGKASPKTLTAEDLPKIIASNKLYARKLNAKIDGEIFDKLDEPAQ